MPKTRDGCGPFGDDENSRTNKCSFCGDSDPEDSVCVDGYTVCAACAEQMDIRDVMDLFGFETVSELIGALLFFCDDGCSGFVTGVVLPVDGGFNAYSGV